MLAIIIEIFSVLIATNIAHISHIRRVSNQFSSSHSFNFLTNNDFKQIEKKNKKKINYNYCNNWLLSLYCCNSQLGLITYACGVTDNGDDDSL